MTEQGKVIAILEKRTGVNPRTGNTWATQAFVIETNDRFPIKMCFTIFGEDKISLARLRLGEILMVVGYPESHQYENNWYTELRCTDIIDNGLSRFVAPMFPTDTPTSPLRY